MKMTYVKTGECVYEGTPDELVEVTKKLLWPTIKLEQNPSIIVGGFKPLDTSSYHRSWCDMSKPWMGIVPPGCTCGAGVITHTYGVTDTAATTGTPPPCVGDK
jgi:hypothetical protein